MLAVILYVHYIHGMSRPLLYNFYNHKCPEEITCLLHLINLWSLWDTASKQHRIYQGPERDRLIWKVQYFKGGSIQQWQTFIAQITDTIYLLP